MNRRSLWRISVATTREAEEAVAELLGRELRRPVSSYTDAATGATTVTVYLEEEPDRYRAAQAKLQTGLAQIGAFGLNIGCAKISQAQVRREDWAESWRKHFQPLEIGSALLIRPSWSRRRARKGQVEVVLDPGLSFGTGQHPTTAFCLRQVVARRIAGEPQALLDMGTGSGILAIAAAKLGYAPVDAFDLDPEAVRIARANGRKNGVGRRIRFFEQDVRKLPGQGGGRYCLVCANLSSSLLVTERKRILSQLKADGVLVLAGVLKTEFQGVQRAYEATGVRLAAVRTEAEWRSASFEFF